MAKMYKCRKCKGLLDRSRHIVFSHYEDRQERIGTDLHDPFPIYRTVQDEIFEHLPCTNCGDPEPLNTVAANLPMVIFLALFLPAMLGGVIWVLFFL